MVLGLRPHAFKARVQVQALVGRTRIPHVTRSRKKIRRKLFPKAKPFFHKKRAQIGASESDEKQKQNVSTLSKTQGVRYCDNCYYRLSTSSISHRFDNHIRQVNN